MGFFFKFKAKFLGGKKEKVKNVVGLNYRTTSEFPPLSQQLQNSNFSNTESLQTKEAVKDVKPILQPPIQNEIIPTSTESLNNVDTWIRKPEPPEIIVDPSTTVIKTPEPPRGILKKPIYDEPTEADGDVLEESDKNIASTENQDIKVDGTSINDSEMYKYTIEPFEEHELKKPQRLSEVASLNDEQVEFNYLQDKPEVNDLQEEQVEVRSFQDEQVEVRSLQDEQVEVKSLQEEQVEVRSLQDEQVEVRSLKDEQVEVKHLSEDQIELKQEEQVEVNGRGDKQIKLSEEIEVINDEQIELSNQVRVDQIKTDKEDDEYVVHVAKHSSRESEGESGSESEDDDEAEHGYSSQAASIFFAEEETQPTLGKKVENTQNNKEGIPTLDVNNI